jgi:serine/threonine-protein kinase
MIGQTIAHYRVTAKLGAGGMGEVYRATDTKLGRDVALKVLPEAFAADAQRMQRFQREAQVLASLNHPHIATIHGLEESGVARALVMELVEGPTLAERLAQGPIPVEEVLPIAKQIAEALEYAHEHGIVHRDLKPANIKLTPDGAAKVLDFGLAKAMQDDPASGLDMANSPTLSLAATKAGVILGTAAYMSPEQARGGQVDKRADIWAFGAVAFEMLTGKRLFNEATATDTLAAVLKSELNLEALPAATPRAIRTLLQRCLERDRKRRLRDIGEARITIENLPAADASREEPAAISRASTPFLPWLAAAALLVIALVLGWRLQHQPAASAPPTGWFEIGLAPNEWLEALNNTNAVVAVSPDGRRLAYVAHRAGKVQIELRPLDALQSTTIPHTEDARAIFFSPDGEWIGFRSGTKMMKVAVAGGSPIEIAPSYWAGGLWTRENSIYYTPHYSGGLVKVSADGGNPEKLTEPDRKNGELGHFCPEMLPDGKTLLFTAFRTPVSRAQIEALSLATGQRTVLVEGGTCARYLPTGHLIFMREEGLMAVPFDAERLAVTGAPMRIMEDAYLIPQEGISILAVSDNGTLVYLPKSALNQPNEVLWLDRKGAGKALPLPPSRYEHPRISPDGTRMSITVAPLSRQDVWVWDLRRNTMTSVAAGPTSEFNAFWTLDGKRLIYDLEKSQFTIQVRAADGTGEPTPLMERVFDTIPSSISSDGKYLLFTEDSAGTEGDIWSLALDGSREAKPYVKTPADDTKAVFSPDGQWVAYESGVSGRAEIYVQSFPQPGERFQISTQGGGSPRWSPKGNEIFYRSGLSMMAVSVETKQGFRAGKPEELFQGEFDRSFPGTEYDVTADGHFLMVRTPPEHAPRKLIVVLNWFEELKRQMSPGK